MAKVKALVCRVGKMPVVEEIEDEYENWKKLVGGLIEIVHLDEGVYMVANEEGRYTKEFNRKVPGRAPEIPEGVHLIIAPPDAAAPGTMGLHDLYGDFALLRSGEEFESLTDKDIEKWRPVLSAPQERAAQ